ncbi:MAG: TatD family hydrolase [Methanosphaera sp.]|uniref:TatD family hydrolase n=1 Tax=Methanosphaera sp. TaxID=2666342 RepID=UPI0025FC42BD|nr:TatD family hydrolase [Methanosphaera sp.]MCI5866508.1 YchF/TatD family DNA exonuclease [Methanosphaera sp.]MDD6534953.1 TatD family hydrolase [Methanosphaera sp.]MDY3955412.1 TatD family hydrolase [Methanosphaera sp.]
MELIDIGLNLMHKSYDKDREDVINNAKDVGVTKSIITGSSIPSSIKAAQYAQKYPGILYSTCGVHPHDAKMCDENTIDTLRSLAEKPSVVAIGECGLDYNRNYSPQNVQRKWFEKQVELAEELNMPLFLHDREAYDDFAKILRKHRSVAKRSVVHCFTGTKYEAEDYLDLGCYIGVTGWICDERRNSDLLKAIRVIPPERLMIETDGPFLIPRDLNLKGKDKSRNEPKYLPHILEVIAKQMNMDAQTLAHQVTENTTQFFNL